MDTRTPLQRGLNGNERRVIGNRGSGEGSFINKCSTSPSSRNDGGCWNDEQDGYVKLAANCSVVLEWHSHGARLCQCDSDGTGHRRDSTVLYRDANIKQGLCDKQNSIGKLSRVFSRITDKAEISDVEVIRNSDANCFHSCDHNTVIPTRIRLTGEGERYRRCVFCSVCFRSSQQLCEGCGELTGLPLGCGDNTFRETDYIGRTGDGIITLKTAVNDGVCDGDKRGGEQNVYSSWPEKSFLKSSDKRCRRKPKENYLNNFRGRKEQSKSRKSFVLSQYTSKYYSLHQYINKFRLKSLFTKLKKLGKLKNNEVKCSVGTIHETVYILYFKDTFILLDANAVCDHPANKSKVSLDKNKTGLTSPYLEGINRFCRHHQHHSNLNPKISHRLCSGDRISHLSRQVLSSSASTSPSSTSPSSTSSSSLSSSLPTPQAPASTATVKACSLSCGHSIYWQSVNHSSARHAGRSVTSHDFDNNPTLCPLKPFSPAAWPHTMASNRPTPPAPNNTSGRLGLSNTNTFPIRDRTVSSDRSPDNRRCDSGVDSDSPPHPPPSPSTPPSTLLPPPLQNNNGEEGRSGSGASSSWGCENKNRGGKDGDGELLVTGEGDGGDDENKTMDCIENNEGARGVGVGEGEEVGKQLPVNMENKQTSNGEEGRNGKDGSEKRLPIVKNAEMTAKRKGEEGEEKTDKEKVMAPSARRNLSHTDGVTSEVDIVGSKTGSSHDSEGKVYSRRVGLSVDDETGRRDAGSQSCDATVSASCKTSCISEYDDDDSIIILNSDYLSPDPCGDRVKSCETNTNESGRCEFPVSGEVREGKTNNCDNVPTLEDSGVDGKDESNILCLIDTKKVVKPTGETARGVSISTTEESDVRSEDTVLESSSSCGTHSNNNESELVQYDTASLCIRDSIKSDHGDSVDKGNENVSSSSTREKRDKWKDRTGADNENSKESGSEKEREPFENDRQLRVKIEDKHTIGRLSTVYANYSNCKNTEPNRSNSDGQRSNGVFSTPVPKDNIVGHPLPDRSITSCDAGERQRLHNVNREHPSASHRLSHQYLNSNCCVPRTSLAEFTDKQSSGMIFTSPTTSDATYMLEKPVGLGMNYKEMPLNTNDNNCREDSRLLLSPKRHTPINKNMGSINAPTAVLVPKNHHYYNYNNDFLRPIVVSSLNTSPGKGTGRGINSTLHHDGSNTNQEREYLCDMSSCCSMYDPNIDNGLRKPLPIKPAFQSQPSPVVFQHNPSHKLGPYYNQKQHAAFCDQCCTQSSDQLLCHNHNFVPYQQQHHHFYQLQQQQQHRQQQQKQHQSLHVKQQRSHHHHAFAINSHDSWVTEFNFVCFKHKFSFTPIALLWTLFSLLISASCLMSFLTPYWMTHPDHAHSFGLINVCIADPQYARNRPLCVRYGEQYYKYNYRRYIGKIDTVNNIIVTGTNETFFERLHKVGSASFGEIPSRAWRTACLMFGAGCVLELIGAVTAVGTLMVWSHWRPNVMRINGYVQSSAVMFLFLGIMIFPAGFDSPTYSYYCQSSGQSYNSGQCSMGWSYIMAVITFALSIFCPVLAWLGNAVFRTTETRGCHAL